MTFDAGPWVPLMLVVLFYVCIAPLLPKTNKTVRVAVAGVAILLMVRYSWWRLTATILPLEPELTWEYAWAVLFYFAETALAFEACIFLVMMSRTVERHTEGDANVEWAQTQTAAQLPSVDVFIPTYNEGWDVLEKKPSSARRRSTIRTFAFTCSMTARAIG